MELRKTIYSVEPSLVEREGATVCINFDVEAKTVTNEASATTSDDKEVETVTQWEGYAVRVAQPMTRDRIVDAIITARYPRDVMQAIINNHLLDEDDTEHLQEWQEMQQWRKHAKEVASQAMEDGKI